MRAGITRTPTQEIFTVQTKILDLRGDDEALDTLLDHLFLDDPRGKR